MDTNLYKLLTQGLAHRDPSTLGRKYASVFFNTPYDIYFPREAHHVAMMLKVLVDANPECHDIKVILQSGAYKTEVVDADCVAWDTSKYGRGTISMKDWLIQELSASQDATDRWLMNYLKK